MKPYHPAFSPEEYQSRLEKVRRSMESRSLEVLIISDPSNMAWLTGYDGWSFYVHQCVVVTLQDAPLWYGRKMDAQGALRTAWLPEQNLLYYPDEYVQSTERHPMNHLSGVLKDRKLVNSQIGVEMDNYYFAAKCLESFRTNLPEAEFLDATGLANWQRAVKSAQELEYMRIAGRIVTPDKDLVGIKPKLSRQSNGLAGAVRKQFGTSGLAHAVHPLVA